MIKSSQRMCKTEEESNIEKKLKERGDNGIQQPILCLTDVRNHMLTGAFNDLLMRKLVSVKRKIGCWMPLSYLLC